MAEDEDFLKTMDEAAKSLLQEAFGATKPMGEPVASDGQKLALADKIKAFSAVRDWLSDRKKIAPPETGGKPKGERLRDQFRASTAPPSRRSRAKATQAPELVGTADTDSAIGESAH